MTAYAEFLTQKRVSDPDTGLIELPSLSDLLFDFQRDIVRWALRRGRAAIFADCGLGKTPMQLEWARHVPGSVLILTPLAVAQQTVREGEKFGIPVTYARAQSQVTGKITTANYEMLEHFDPAAFTGIVLDESSILKSHDGVTRTRIIEAFQQTPFRLACTATPAPNDYMELGNHAEFLGTMTRTEMLSMFFVHDGGETQQWRLKGHATEAFWEWVCSWAVMLRKPSDLGYNDGAFQLPSVRYHSHVTAAPASEGHLFPVEAQTLQERIQARRDSTPERVAQAEKVIRHSWTKTPSANTTAHTEKPTGTRSSLGGKNGTPRTQSESAGARESMQPPTALSGSQPPHDTTLPTEKRSANTCAPATRRSAKKSSPSSGSGASSDSTFTETGISEVSSESVSRSTPPSSNAKMAAAPSAAPNPSVPRSQLITATRAESSEDSSAADATTDSDDSRTTPADSAEPLSTLRPQWVVWCNLNAEQDALASRLGNACVSIYGSLTPDEKIRRYARFSSGEVAVLITKPSIFGWGLNMQFSHHALFLGLSDSYEAFYQAIRRQWRFGQTEPVEAHTITAETEGAVVANIKRKEAEAARMAEEMVDRMHDLNAAAVHGMAREAATYEADVKTGKGWTLHLGDCVDGLATLAEGSMHYSIFSPPFASLYTYSNSERDLGNSRTYGEFAAHFQFVVRELYRVTMAGRLCSFHCMNLPTSKVRDGVIGIRDFRGDLIRAFEAEGWIYHSEVVIWKDPVTAMQRTKALGLLHKQLKKDSAMSRQGIPDYLVTMRKPGENPERISHTAQDFPVELWQRYASPVWMDINPSDTLQYRSAREHEDERHICPLQLDVIRRALKMWSRPGDTVLSPFAGIGSEGVVALEEGRQFLGMELKRSYWEQACRNLAAAETHRADLFDDAEALA